METAIEVIKKGYNALEWQGEKVAIIGGVQDTLYVRSISRQQNFSVKVSEVQVFCTVKKG